MFSGKLLNNVIVDGKRRKEKKIAGTFQNYVLVSVRRAGVIDGMDSLSTSEEYGP